MRKIKMTDEDSFCIECAGVQQYDQSAPVDPPKLRSSSEVEKMRALIFQLMPKIYSIPQYNL